RLLRAAADALAVALLALAARDCALWLGAAAFAGKHGNDFKHIYLGARLLADGGNPYDRDQLHAAAALIYGPATAINPYVYLPSTGQALRPLASLSPAEAESAWFFLNHIFLWTGFVLLAAPKRGAPWPPLLLLALGAW